MNHQASFFLSILAKFGWLGNWLFLLIAFIECVPIIGGFFPGGTLISLAGFFAAQGYFSVFDVFLFALIGAIFGDFLGYSLGRYASAWLEGKGLVKKEFRERGENFFKKYGPLSIFWGRFIGATRAVVPFVAGSSKMSPRRFLLWNTASAVVWALYNVGLGYFAGNLIATIIKKWSHELWLIIAVAIFLFLIYWLIKKHGQNIWQYFELHSSRFTTWLLARQWFNVLNNRYPVAGEFFQTKTSQERIFGGLLAIIVLLVFYFLVIIFDLF
ncbi:MAG: DedA family protein [Patescibacteria group bacterium]